MCTKMCTFEFEMGFACFKEKNVWLFKDLNHMIHQLFPIWDSKQ